jgi:hypothetical protein
MNIIWDSAELGLCYQGCAFTYCNPLHVGMFFGTLITVIVIVIWLNQRKQEQPK